MSKSFVFDTVTGKRTYRRLSERVRAHIRWKAVALQVLEIVGVGLLAVAGATIHIAIGLVIVGLFAILVANVNDE